MRNKTLCMTVLAAVSFSAAATDIDFTYNVDNKEPKAYGFDKKEKYDVAIKIDDPVYVGAKVTGFTVDLPVGTGAIDAVSGWLSTELKIENKVNVPDITTKSATVVDEMLNVTFDEPCTIGSSGIWVGYSFSITSLGEEYHWPGSPVACVESESDLDKGLWIHTSRSRLKWTNLGSTLGAVSPMVVHLATDFGPYDAAIVVPAQNYMVSGETYGIPFKVVNHGTSPLEDIEFSYTVGSHKATGSLHLDTPVQALGSSATVTFPLGPVAETGEYPFTLTLEKSNGQPNTDPMRSGSGTMNVWPIIPVTRPLVEEFTGLGCGWCPRGYVAMEYMKETLGDMFVGMAFHSQTFETGSMVTVSDSDFPVYVDGYPWSDFNRRDMMDPSYLPFRWDAQAAVVSPAAVELAMDWTDDSRSQVEMTSTLTFAKDIDNADYKLAFALVADGLKNDSWKQSNYYAGEEYGDGVETPLWDTFLTGNKKVAGLTFNDVVVYFKEEGMGIEGSVPASVKAGEKLNWSYRVDLADVKNLKNEYFINKGATIHGVVILLDGKTGYAVNCNKSASLVYEYEPAGIKGLDGTDAGVVDTRFHSLQGAEVENPSNGIFIKTEILEDGSRRTSKVAIR